MSPIIFIALDTALAPETGGASLANYMPTMESWAKLFNLVLFVALMTYILRRPIGEALRTRREGIRRDLMRAQEERNAALAKLEEVEERLAQLDGEVKVIRAQAEKEAAEERARIERSTEEDARKLREQARREIQNAGKAARHDLRRYAAEQSVCLAEEMILRDIRPEDDARLASVYADGLGGINR